MKSERLQAWESILGPPSHKCTKQISPQCAPLCCNHTPASKIGNRPPDSTTNHAGSSYRSIVATNESKEDDHGKQNKARGPRGSSDAHRISAGSLGDGGDL